MLCEEIENQTQEQDNIVYLDLPTGVPALNSLYLYISGSCNLNCQHCWINPEFNISDKSDKFLSLENIEKAINEALPLGLSFVKLSGGEPLLHPQFKEILTLVERYDLRLSIETNGVLIDTFLADFMSNMKRPPFISVSVDGAQPGTHDALRQVKGSHQKAISGLQALIVYGFKPQVICTLHKNNIVEMEDLIFLAEQMGCGSVKFNHIQKVGRGETLHKTIGLDINEIIAIYDKVINELQPKHIVRLYFDIPIAYSPIKKLLTDSSNRCNVFNILGILSSGELSLCGIGVTVPELIFGHVSRNSLKDVWHSHPFLKELRAALPSKLEGICADCIHRSFCLGSCIAHTFYQTHKLTSPFNFCRQADELGLFPISRKKTTL